MERKVIRLGAGDLQNILYVEERAFIPSIRTHRKNIVKRLKEGHVYLGAEVDGKIVGTLACRFARFTPDFSDFKQRYPAFKEYAELPNEPDSNTVFVYSIGVLPDYRDGINAKNLLMNAHELSRGSGMEFLVGDARVPSYDGSFNLPFEQFDKNPELRRAIDGFFRTQIIPARKLIEQDPVAGFYLRVFPEGEILGITNSDFWKGDEPCGGHMVIEYLKLK